MLAEIPVGLLAPTLVALAGSVLLTPLVIRLARSRGWVDRPSETRWHRRPTAVMGGIAIFLAASAGWAVLGTGGSLSWIWAGGALLFVCGVVDDRRGLSPSAKLSLQLAASGVLLAGGLALAPAWPFWVSVPLTILWVVGITNAMNLLDNMDGLAAGVGGIAALALAALAWGNGAVDVAAACLVLAAAALGFLVYNVRPARIFMGDCGSLFLGFCLAGASLAATRAGTGGTAAVAVLVPAVVLAVPIFDTTLVTVNRLRAGRSVAHGGRDHSSHRLVALGLGERTAVLVLYGVAILFGGVALALQGRGAAADLGLLATAVLGLVALGILLSRIPVYESREDRSEARRRARAGTAQRPIPRWPLRPASSAGGTEGWSARKD